jgi:capsular polysaccharide biosynthesis protein
VTERPAEATSNDRWQAEADEPLADRPGILASLWRYRLIVLVVMLLGAVAGYGLAQRLPVRYEAEASLILSDPGGPSFLGGSPLPSSDRGAYLAKQADIMTSSVVLGRAQQLLRGQQSLSDLRQEVTVKPSGDLASISIRAASSDPKSAAALANAVGTAYQQVTAERSAQDAQRAIASIDKIKARLQDEIDTSLKSPDGSLTSRQQQLAGQIKDLQQREQDIATQASVNASGVELFERAAVPTSPTPSKSKLYAVIGALLGLLGAGAWAWWAAARNQRAEGRADPARILGAPLLGEVPQLKAEPLLASPQTLGPAGADAYHSVVAALGHELTIVGGSSVVVTSVTPDENKTSTTLQIASAALEEDRKILLIDADERTRRLSQLCGVIDNASGEGNAREPVPVKADEAIEGKKYVSCLVLTRSGMVLPVTPNGSGRGHRSTPVPAPQVRQALRSVGNLFDLVLIDAPALLEGSGAMSVAGQADGVVLVVNHRVLLNRLRDVRERLAFVDTPLIGYVYVRPTGAGVRTLWGRARRHRGNEGRRNIVTGPDPISNKAVAEITPVKQHEPDSHGIDTAALQLRDENEVAARRAQGGSGSDRLGPPPRVSPRRWRHTTASRRDP